MERSGPQGGRGLVSRSGCSRVRLAQRRSRVKWLCATTAPWALAVGLLVSFTAARQQRPEGGRQRRRPGSPRGLIGGTDLVPAVAASPADLGWLSPGRAGAARRRGLDAERARGPTRPSRARADRKAEARADPAVDRTRKGDPAGALLPTLSRRAGELRRPPRRAASRLVLDRDERLLPPTILMEGKVEGAGRRAGFRAVEAPELTTTRQATSIQSPAAAAAGSTGAAASATTPSVRRAVVLSSTTPAPADMTPVEIAAAPGLAAPRPTASAATDRRPRTTSAPATPT